MPKWKNPVHTCPHLSTLDQSEPWAEEANEIADEKRQARRASKMELSPVFPLPSNCLDRLFVLATLAPGTASIDSVDSFQRAIGTKEGPVSRSGDSMLSGWEREFERGTRVDEGGDVFISFFSGGGHSAAPSTLQPQRHRERKAKNWQTQGKQRTRDHRAWGLLVFFSEPRPDCGPCPSQS